MLTFHLYPPTVKGHSQFAALWGVQEFTDCTIKCEGKSWACHKLILGTQSEWFKKALTGQFSEAKTGIVTITDMQPWMVEEVLKFLYNGSESKD